MIFGDPNHFAVEAVVELGPEFAPLLGNNVVGRIRVFAGGLAYGDFNEPSCVLRPVSEHLVELCERLGTLWHPSLSSASPDRQFNLLDVWLFLGGSDEPEPEGLAGCIFLTNVSEAFDNIKAFLVCPPTGSAYALLQVQPSSAVCRVAITSAEFCSVATAFASWLESQEHGLLQSRA